MAVSLTPFFIAWWTSGNKSVFFYARIYFIQTIYQTRFIAPIMNHIKRQLYNYDIMFLLNYKGRSLEVRTFATQGVVVVLPDTHLDTWGQFFIPPLRSICVTYYTNYSQNIRKLSSLKEVYIANNDDINCVYFKISNTLLNFSLHIYFF